MSSGDDVKMFNCKIREHFDVQIMHIKQRFIGEFTINLMYFKDIFLPAVYISEV